jgi:hypothetical protein
LNQAPDQARPLIALILAKKDHCPSRRHTGNDPYDLPLNITKQPLKEGGKLRKSSCRLDLPESNRGRKILHPREEFDKVIPRIRSMSQTGGNASDILDQRIILRQCWRQIIHSG